MRSDEDLMAAWVAGDAAAFREIFARYAPVLLRVVRRQLARTEEANDLVQQTFLQLHRSRNDFTPGAKLRPWLFTIAINLKREHFRRVKRRPEAPLELDGRLDPAEAPRGVEQSEAAREIRGALGRISAEQREVIELHWLEGLAFSEIAELVGASLSAVKVRAHRGYAALRKAIDAGNPMLADGIAPGEKKS